MTKRELYDYFCGQALAGVMAAEYAPVVAAGRVYQVARLMMEQREEELKALEEEGLLDEAQ